MDSFRSDLPYVYINVQRIKYFFLIFILFVTFTFV